MKDDNDKWVALGLAATTTDTLWEKLTKPGKGFKFDGEDKFAGIPPMKYLDEAMRKKYGGHQANPLWTKDNREEVIKALIEELSEKITGDPHFLDDEEYQYTPSTQASTGVESYKPSKDDSESDDEVQTTSKKKRARIESDSDEDYDM